MTKTDESRERPPTGAALAFAAKLLPFSLLVAAVVWSARLLSVEELEVAYPISSARVRAEGELQFLDLRSAAGSNPGDLFSVESLGAMRAVATLGEARAEFGAGVAVLDGDARVGLQYEVPGLGIVVYRARNGDRAIVMSVRPERGPLSKFLKPALSTLIDRRFSPTDRVRVDISDAVGRREVILMVDRGEIREIDWYTPPR